MDNAVKGAGGLFVTSAKLLFLIFIIRSRYSQRLSYALLPISFPCSDLHDPIQPSKALANVMNSICLIESGYRFEGVNPALTNSGKLGVQTFKPADFRAIASLPAIGARLN